MSVDDLQAFDGSVLADHRLERNRALNSRLASERWVHWIDLANQHARFHARRHANDCWRWRWRRRRSWTYDAADNAIRNASRNSTGHAAHNSTHGGDWRRRRVLNDLHNLVRDLSRRL